MNKKEHDPNKRHYFTELEGEDLKPFLHDVKRLGFEVTLWEKGQNKDDAENYMLEEVLEEDFALKLSRKGGFLSKISGSPLVGKNILIKVPAGKYTYFGTGKLDYDADTNAYTAHMERYIFRSQQRTNYRLKTNSYIKVQIKWGEYVYQCNDISAGGTSFILSEEQAQAFEKDQERLDGILHFNGKNFAIPKARVAGKFENKDADGNVIDGVKIGLAFQDLPKETEESLTIHINSEARADEIRKKFSKEKKEKQSS